MRKQRNAFWVGRILVASLAFVLAIEPIILSAQKRQGAILEIILKDGRIIKGELITIKEGSLFVKQATKPDGLPIKISKISSIILRGKHQFDSDMGCLVGGCLGAVGAIGAMWSINMQDGLFGEPKVSGIGALAIMGGGAIALGILGGAVGGGGKKIKEVISFENKTPEEINVILTRLNSLSRKPSKRFFLYT